MIDLHSHVLPGIDDGARDLDDALVMCRAAAEDGISILAGTPHVRSDYPTTADQMMEALAELRDAAGGLIRLVSGGEIAFDELERPVEELRRFGLAGNPGVLLVETPYVGWPLDFGHRLQRLRDAAIVPVLAHPERNPDVQLQPGLLMPLVESGALVQLTAASVDGRLGKATRDCARYLIDHELAHLIASDAHNPAIREIGLRDAAQAVGDDALAQWLTLDVPSAIVDGRPIPVRPPRAHSRLQRLLRR